MILHLDYAIDYGTVYGEVNFFQVQLESLIPNQVEFKLIKSEIVLVRPH